MSKLRVHGFGVSLDGYGAGPGQSKEHPLGIGGSELHEWLYPTRTFGTMHGDSSDGTTGIDDEYARRGVHDIGAWILGRNMFGPIRGPWPDESWKGWWGQNPPYHVPVFVLTHHARRPLEMDGGTTFHFVTGGIEEALQLAREAAGSKDVRLGGGVDTIRQYVRAGLVDELHLAMAPVLLGSGQPLLSGLNLLDLGYQVTEHRASEAAMHITIERSTAGEREPDTPRSATARERRGVRDAVACGLCRSANRIIGALGLVHDRRAGDRRLHGPRYEFDGLFRRALWRLRRLRLIPEQRQA